MPDSSRASLDPTERLRIATRIHFALLRRFGEHVAVSALLQGSDEAREALWVCEASGEREMLALAIRFRSTEPRAALPAVPQEAVWGQDTSGFGLSQPIDEVSMAMPSASPGARWLSPAAWARRRAGT